MARVTPNVERLLLLGVISCFWPTGDGLYSLNAYSKPDAQGAAPKVSFAVL